MAANRKNTFTLGANGANVLRIIIASYFVAVGAGFVPGSDPAILFRTLLPDPIAGYLASGIVFALAFCVLAGLWLRPAALLLALLLLWTSVFAISTNGLNESLGGFWRDLALMAALVMTYAEPSPRNRTRQGIFRITRKPQRPWPVQPKRVVKKVVDNDILHFDRARANREFERFGDTVSARTGPGTSTQSGTH